MRAGREVRVRRGRAAVIVRFAPAVALMGAIFFSSHRPLPTAMPGDWDKVVHAVAYAVLAGCWFWALGGVLRRTGRVALVSAGIAAAWGIVDEIHQSFVPGRFASAGDALADAVGAVAASAALYGLGSVRADKGRERAR